MGGGGWRAPRNSLIQYLMTFPSHEPFFSQWFIWIIGRPGKILHGWESWNKKWIIALIGCQCSKSLHPCHKPHKCLCFWKFMAYWATVASGFDSTTTASSNSFKSIGDWPLILKGKERGLKILKVSISWMLCWQLYFMKWLFIHLDFFFPNNSLLPQENQKIRNGIRTCRSGRALIFLQEGSRMNENVLSWLYIFFTPNISRTWWWDQLILSEHSAHRRLSALHEGNVAKARGTELPAREDSGLLKMFQKSLFCTDLK